ncbi:xylulokinase [Paenibacillus naphthalenovorans]|uniref:xylulokinase n=1 Tax=Paenibacillus naphthalenovorans TaxID=162209 RepID=UPI003D2A6090
MPFIDAYLGIDLGTTSVKATLIDRDWGVLQQRRIEYSSYQIKPMWIEQDPWEWWSAACRAIREVIGLAQIDAKLIKAVSVSGQAPSLLGVDPEGQPLGRAMIWMDRRSEDACRMLASTVGESAVRAVSGNRIDPYYMLPKLLWEMNHAHDKYRKTARYLQANGWIVFQLTGQYSMDVSHAALTQLYHIHRGEWEASLMKELGIDGSKLPNVYDCTEVVGGISRRAAELFGLTEGTPVIAGAIDGAAAPLGLKLYQAHQSFEMSGQSSGIGMILDQPVSHPNLALLRHCVDDKWILKGSMSASGGSLRWFRDHVDEAPGHPEMYGEYEKLAAAVPPGSNGLLYLPYLAGERAPLWDSYAKGVFFGLHYQTGRADMVRAIMEGTAYGLKSILGELEKVNLCVTDLYGTGGGYLNQEWSQIKADILEKEIQVAFGDIETASLGSSYLALMAVTGLKASQLPGVSITRTYRPNEQNQRRYRGYYAMFKSLYENNKDMFRNLSLVGEMN